jgi:acyl-CoA thioesterase-1
MPQPKAATLRKLAAPALAVALAALTALFTFASDAAARPIRIVAFGDSLTEGLGLPKTQAFPAQLEAALRAKGYEVEIVNAGVSGETAPQGLMRLDWSVPAGTDAVIVELGANDMLRGQNPDGTRRALTEIVRRLKAKNISVLLAGMRAAPNLGADYAARFDPLFPEIAAQEGVLLYPFFLDNVAGDRALNQPDGLHPNTRGVAAIIAGILPKVEELIAQVKAKGGAGQ